jgi:V8-like Glu-specific endopeptidase
VKTDSKHYNLSLMPFPTSAGACLMFQVCTLTSPEAVLEKLIGESTLVATSFLEQAIELAHPVAYIEVDKVSFIEIGTGFMISPSLLITCHHVLPKNTLAREAIFRFNYQQNRLGVIGPVKDFQWKEKGLFHTDAELDYTIVELEGEPGQEWKFIPLKSGYSVKRDARVNIIQHPNGRPKQISFRNNFVEYVNSKIIQYVTHTEQGSSGSPVFNDRWQLVALHHAGGNVREPTTQRQYYRNQGIVITAILESMPQIVRDALVVS